MTTSLDPSTTKYLIKAKITADGVVEKPDVVGAIFGQTEGLIGDDLDLRDLQKTGRMGRIEVEMKSNKGKSEGEIMIPSSLDQVETAILASALETIDRVGPCKAKINLISVADVRAERKRRIIDRAKEILQDMMEKSRIGGIDLTDTVRQSVQVEEITLFGENKCPAGPNIDSSDAIIVVEGRSDVLNLLKYGIKNVIAVGGTNVPKTIKDLSQAKVVTAFVDGDRGGELILKELMQVAEIDFIARAPRSSEVEELSQKQIIKALRNKVPSEQFLELYGLGENGKDDKGGGKDKKGGYQRGGKRDYKKGGGQHQKSTPKPPPEPPKKLSPDQEKFKGILKTLSGTLKAHILNKDWNVIKEVPVRNLADTLSSSQEDIETVVFDGIISQRLLDIATEHKIKNIVGVKVGNIIKQPSTIQIVVKNDLE
jgi:DNA primase